MTRPSFSVDRLSLLGKLRWASVGMATAEVIYLVGWMGVDLGLLEAPAFGHAVGGSPGSLRSLAAGMLGAAAPGIAAGLVTAFGVNLFDIVTGRRVRRQSDQAFARSLCVRNHTR